MVSTLGSVHTGTKRSAFLTFLDLGSRKPNMKLQDLIPTVRTLENIQSKILKIMKCWVSIITVSSYFFFGVLEFGTQSRWKFSWPYEPSLGYGSRNTLKKNIFSTLAVLEVSLLRVCESLILSMEYTEAWPNTSNKMNEKRNYNSDSKMASHLVLAFLLSRQYIRENSTNQNCLNAGPPPLPALPGIRRQWSIIASKACKTWIRTPLPRWLI